MNAQPGTPAVSIIMPIYQGAATLDRALRSVHGQTFPGWEVVAVDDGSTDGSYDILRQWAGKDPRIRALRLDENGGVSAARNAAIRMARADSLAYLDQDDEYHCDYLAHVVRLGGQADVLVFGYDFVFDDGPANGRPPAWNPLALQHDFFVRCIVTPLGVAHRRALWAAAGGFNETWCYGEEDWDLWKRMARAGAEFVFLSLKSGRCHVHPDRASVIPHITARFLANWEAGKPLYGGRPLGTQPRKVRKIAFASPHCLIDSFGGASIATSQLLQLLQGSGFECRAFCGPRLDAPEGTTLEDVLAGRPHGNSLANASGYDAGRPRGDSLVDVSGYDAGRRLGDSLADASGYDAGRRLGGSLANASGYDAGRCGRNPKRKRGFSSSEQSGLDGDRGQILRCAQNDDARAQNDDPRAHGANGACPLFPGICRTKLGGCDAEMILTSQGTVPVAVFSAPFTASGWFEKAEATAFYEAYTAFLDDYRPDVLLTYGGHPVAVSMIELAKKRDIPVVFALHNFSYSRAEPFKAVDYVIVPSDFCRRYYWDKLGLACQKLPNVIDWRRVEAQERNAQYVTFVNTVSAKWIFVGCVKRTKTRNAWCVSRTLRVGWGYAT